MPATQGGHLNHGVDYNIGHGNITQLEDNWDRTWTPGTAGPVLMLEQSKLEMWVSKLHWVEPTCRMSATLVTVSSRIT